MPVQCVMIWILCLGPTIPMNLWHTHSALWMFESHHVCLSPLLLHNDHEPQGGTVPRVDEAVNHWESQLCRPARIVYTVDTGACDHPACLADWLSQGMQDGTQLAGRIVRYISSAFAGWSTREDSGALADPSITGADS